MKIDKEILTNLVLLVLGNLILAFGVTFFIIPNNILSGGVAGVAIALYPIVKIDVTVMMNIIIGVAFVLGYVALGKKFALKTLASSILYPLFVNLMTQQNIATEVDPLLASIFGGILMGAGLGLTFRTGASTGGMDVPPLVLEKITNIRVSVWIFIVDAITVMLGYQTYGINAVLTGFLSIYATTLTIDKISLLGGEQARQVTIISDYYNEILEHLHLTLGRGSTLIPARGGYTLNNKEIIITVITRREYHELEQAVLEVDPEAFLIVSNVTEVHGLGFRKN